MSDVLYESPTVTVTVDGVRAELELTRPDVLNRFDDPLHVDMTAALRAIETHAGLRVAVWRSTGRCFSAGGDFELMLAANRDVQERLRIVDDGLRLLGALLDVKIPIVVALHGDVFGVGTSLVLASDIVIAHPRVRIGDPHVGIGLVAGDGGCLVWPQNAGMLRAKRHLLTGDPLDGAAAAAMGLVSELVDGPDDVLPAARAFADRLAALPPLAVQGTKRALNRVLRARFDEVIELSFAHEVTTLASEDLREAIAAFKESRPGRFTGR